MNVSMPTLQHKIDSAKDLHSVVRTMKAMAAANINQYEKAVISLEDYYRTVRLGVTAYMCRQITPHSPSKTALNMTLSDFPKLNKSTSVGIIIFGSDQGLVGNFNDRVFSFMTQKLPHFSSPPAFWPVGERIQSRLIDKKFNCTNSFTLPRNIQLVSTLVTELLLEIDEQRQQGKVQDIYLFFNRPLSKIRYAPSIQKLLPLDNQWRLELALKQWPGRSIPQLINSPNKSLTSLLHEYLFVSLFRACAASLASENASRLVSMQRAEKNIEEIQEQLYRNYHQQRQHSVDEELFDLVAGFEALNTPSKV